MGEKNESALIFVIAPKKTTKIIDKPILNIEDLDDIDNLVFRIEEYLDANEFLGDSIFHIL